MEQKKFLKELLRTPQTVFSFKELLLQFTPDDIDSFKAKLHYYVKNGDLHHIRRGLYAKSADYNQLELATKILTPAYVSFETVLRDAGIIFQYYREIFVASYQSRSITCDGQVYTFRTMKAPILTNALGIKILDAYSIATPERAFLDIVYRTKRYHFDNLEPLRWDLVYELLPVYEASMSMRARVDMYHKAGKEGL